MLNYYAFVVLFFTWLVNHFQIPTRCQPVTRHFLLLGICIIKKIGYHATYRVVCTTVSVTGVGLKQHRPNHNKMQSHSHTYISSSARAYPFCGKSSPERRRPPPRPSASPTCPWRCPGSCPTGRACSWWARSGWWCRTWTSPSETWKWRGSMPVATAACANTRW